MTDISPATARARRGRRGARVLSWLAAAAIVVAPLASPASALAETSPSSSSTPDVSPTPGTPGIASLIAAPANGGTVATGTDALISVDQRNGSPRPLPAGTVSVSLSRSALASQQAVVDWLRPGDDAEEALPVFEEVARADVAELAAGDERATNVSISATEKDLVGLAPGVYPVAVSGPGGSSRTVITVPRTDAPPRSTTVIVPITAGARTSGLLTATELTELTAENGALSATLNAVTGTPAVLAVDPAIVASIRVLGSSAPATATGWLASLMALPNERFALQFGDADLATQVHAGLMAPLEPTTLAPYADPANFSAAGSTTAEGVPDLRQLLAVGTAANTVRDIFWPAGGTAGPDVVAAIDAQAGADADALTLVPSDTVSGGDGGVRAATGDADLLVYDDLVSAELARVAAASDDAPVRSAELAAATAQVALSGEGPLVATIDRPATTSRAGVRTAITAITGAAGAAPTSLQDLRAAAPGQVAVADIPADADRVAALQRFLADEERLATFATALVEPTQLTARERTAILQLIGDAWLTEPTAWAAAVAQHEENTESTLDAVGIANPGTINFLATSAPIPVTVRNDLPWPVSLVLFAETGDPRLIVQKATVVEAGAQQNTRVDVPVEARVGSGETTLSLQLRSTSAVPIGAPEAIGLTVRAEWESVGITAIIVIVVVLIAGGVIRTILKLRRRRSETASEQNDIPEQQESIE
ncbi:hypothetical protein CBF90_01755 [Microbacterium sp. AISO3]|uniref:DUF6049 family protein n=1 Tax=Microbacterium sp. AISO3 TaxID=2002831 RepID=UPI000B4CCB13|nr:DUF6049 family protein [Microbacterium sp. AISO3]OWP20363.1 hypothetical protein CBF90_17490 [Microbacterium sp. AISO3]OWP23484.1 hypothetical protein CBF90_01755 [Microbacterium sp. AISO3]